MDFSEKTPFPKDPFFPNPNYGKYFAKNKPKNLFGLFFTFYLARQK